MTRGDEAMTRQQIEDALDKNFARLGGGMGGRMMRMGSAAAAARAASRSRCETKRANLPAVLEILRQVLREPTLPANEFEVLKNETDSPASNRDAPTRCVLGINRLQRLLSRTPATTSATCPTIDEQLERTRKLTLDQVRTLYREYLGADHGELVVVGDFEPSEVLPILAKTFEGWKAEKPYARIERPVPGRTEARARHDRDARQGQRRVLSRPPDRRSRTAIPIIPRWSPATTSWAAAPVVPDRRPTPPERRALLHRAVDVRRRPVRCPRRPDGLRDL